MNPFPLSRCLEQLGPLLLAVRGDPGLVLHGAGCDSRTVRPGWLFVAIPGSREDGLRYVPAALQAGAVAVAAEREPSLPPGIAFLHVSAAYPAAACLAECAHGEPARRLRLLGITGTKGKTTSAYLLRDLLRAAGRRVGMIGTVEYDLGACSLPADRTTPPPFLLQELLGRMVENGLEDAVLEVSSHALDQRRPGRARFAGALFTNLTGDHADYHPTPEDYYQAKKRLFSEYLAPGAPAVINIDPAPPWPPAGARLAAELRAAGAPADVLTFGRDPAAEAQLLDVDCSLGGSRFAVALAGRRYAFRSPLLGAFNAYNLGAAATLALRLGVPDDVVRDTVARFTGAPGRLQALPAAGGATVFVDYAHTDDALRNVLETLRALRPRRLLLLFGCGGDRDRTKRPRMGAVAARLADRLYLTSDNPRTEDPAAILADIRAGMPPGAGRVEEPDRRAAIRRAVADLGPGDILLVAGKGHESYQEIGAEKLPFDDVAEVRTALRLAGAEPR
jgi:UDP-N-acetylmuramoyl-L-alanyl-D-glutamate--2,6-diaminopimelate ligase